MIHNNRFENPPAEYRVHPFWFWNGSMEENEIERQIGEMKAQGVGGFFICARQGISIPYLSKMWFDKVKFAIQTAERLGLNVWLYDEYPYPSGIAGGEVTLEHPEAKQRMLSRTAAAVEAEAGKEAEAELVLPWGKVLWAKAVPISVSGFKQWDQSMDVTQWIGNYQDETVFQQTGSTSYSRKRYFTYNTVKKLHCKLPAGVGKWEIIIIIEQEIDDFKYYGTFVDPLHPEAVRTFMQWTHERYAQETGEFFGNTVKGMFTDEIGLRAGKIPWSPMIPPFFEKRCGYSLLDRLHLLFENGGEDTARVRYDFYQCVHIMLRDNFHKVVSDWCEEHYMDYVAEVPGVRMTTQRYSHIPGGDSAHEKLGVPLSSIMKRYAHSLRHNPKMGSSLSRQLGRNKALIECFHSIGWSMTLQDARWMIDWMAVLGTNMFNFHAFFYSIDGLRKHDAAPSQFDQNPYWNRFKILGDYAGRLSYVMSEGQAHIEIALLDPTTSLWTHAGNPFHQFNFGGIDQEDKWKLEQLKSDWIDIQTVLLTHQRDYDTLDPELLMEANIGEGSINIGAGRYKVLVIPPVTNLEAAAWSKIKKFIQAGGTVIAVGSIPYENIEPGSVTVAEMAAWFQEQGREGAHFIPLSAINEGMLRFEPLIRLLEEKLPRAVQLTGDDGQADSLLMQIRQLDGGSSLVFIANHGNSVKQVCVHFAHAYFGSAIHLAYLDLENGETRPLASEPADVSGERIVKLKFEPYQSHLIEVRNGMENRQPFDDSGIQTEGVQEAFELQVASDTDWQLQLNEPNLLRLGHFQMTIDETNAGLEQQWHLNGGALPGVEWYDVDAKPWINQCADYADKLKHPLTYSSRWFGTPYKVSVAYPVVCWYKASFEVEQLPEACELYMDREAILGEYSMYVNGVVREPEGPLPLVTGTNTIMIRMVIKHPYEGVVDPLYLQGEFGVRFTQDRHPVVTAAPSAGNPNDLVINGCPYYSGRLLFRREFSVTLDPSEPVELFELSLSGLSPHFHDCAEIKVNGHSAGVRAWTPYVWKGKTEWLKPGANDMELIVDNTLSMKLDGTYFDYEQHKLKETADFHYSVQMKEDEEQV